MRGKKELITEHLTNTNILCWEKVSIELRFFYSIGGTSRGVKKPGSGIIKRKEGVVGRSGVTELNYNKT